MNSGQSIMQDVNNQYGQLQIHVSKLQQGKSRQATEASSEHLSTTIDGYCNASMAQALASSSKMDDSMITIKPSTFNNDYKKMQKRVEVPDKFGNQQQTANKSIYNQLISPKMKKVSRTAANKANQSKQKQKDCQKQVPTGQIVHDQYSPMSY